MTVINSMLAFFGFSDEDESEESDGEAESSGEETKD